MDNLPINAGLTQDIGWSACLYQQARSQGSGIPFIRIGLTWIDILKYYLPDRESIVSATTMTSQDKNFFWETIHCGHGSSSAKWCW